MNRNIRLFFEFRVPLISYCLYAICIFVLFLIGNNINSLQLLASQFGCVLVIGGFFIRVLSSMTIKYLGKIKITGIYAICRHPMLLGQFISVVGLNFIIANPYFFVFSFIVFFGNDFFLTKKYDKILSHHYKEIWKIYSSQTKFVIPITSRITSIFKPSIDVNELDDSSNSFIFIAIYCILIEIAMFSSI